MKLCLSIGVSITEGLEDLPGAIIAAKEIGEWAKNSGFETIVLTDEDGDVVTIDKVKAALLKLLDVSEKIEHFILHFAGHGIREAVQSNCWLPGNWKSEMRVINVEGLLEKLSRYGIKSLSIFSDACRMINTEIDSTELTLDHVLSRGPYVVNDVIVDRFNAARDKGETFMLHGDKEVSPRCIFTTVLIDGLYGFDQRAFDEHETNKVIASSLARYAETRVKELAQIYDLKCSSDCRAGNPGNHVTFFLSGSERVPAVKPTWPVPKNKTSTATSTLFQKTTAYPVRDTMWKEGEVNVKRNLDILPNSHLLNERMGDANLLLVGKEAIRVWSASTYQKTDLRTVGNGNRYVVQTPISSGTQVLIQFEDGIFASAVVYPNLKTVLLRDDSGVIGWTCFNDNYVEPKVQIERSLSTIFQLQEDVLAASEIDKLAGILRENKHIDPTLGAICTYLYSYTGDKDNIARTAFYYCVYDQGMPFDLALMGQFPISRTQRNIIHATVHGRPGRLDTPENRQLPIWVTRETPDISGNVAGLWPFLRQGWQFNDNPELSGLQPEELERVIKNLLPSQFTSFKTDGAEFLIDKFRMRASR